MQFLNELFAQSRQRTMPFCTTLLSAGSNLLIACFITGLCHVKLNVEEGIFTVKDAVIFNVFQLIGNVVAWIIVAPVLDIVIYAEPKELVFTQGVAACIPNAISMAIFGTLLLFIYSKTRAKKGSLTQED